MTTAQKLKQAIIAYREECTNVYENEGISTFVALFNMLGETELRDGICTAMQDEGFDEVYEDIMYHYDGDK